MSTVTETINPEALRYRRKRIGMTQQELGDALGVTKVTISAWEVKRRSIPYHYFDAICEALETSFEDLTTEEDEEDRQQANEKRTEAYRNHVNRCFDDMDADERADTFRDLIEDMDCEELQKVLDTMVQRRHDSQKRKEEQQTETET